jgi:cytochrome P450
MKCSLTGAIILKIVYGYSAESSKPDPLIRMIEALEHNFDAAAKPWTWLPDIIPFAQNLPGWIPGIQFIETARRFRETNREVIDTPFAFVQRQIANGVDQSSAISRLLELHSECNREGILERAAANLYIGGADVVDSTVVTFFGAMVMHPEIQKKAQMEIDSVVGEGRLPTFGDQEKLPYCNAIFKESYRSTTTAPLGAISVAEKDIIWKEHFIPKGSTIVPAAWWFRNDPAVYKDPDLFDPERFLSPRNEPEVGKTLFGFGRRACPGRYLADATIFLTIVQTLAAFDIRKSVDERGVEIDIHLEAQPGTIGRPGEFPYRLTPRSAEAIEWVRDIGRKYPWEASELYPSEKMSAAH